MRGFEAYKGRCLRAGTGETAGRLPCAVLTRRGEIYAPRPV